MSCTLSAFLFQEWTVITVFDSSPPPFEEIFRCRMLLVTHSTHPPRRRPLVGWTRTGVPSLVREGGGLESVDAEAQHVPHHWARSEDVRSEGTLRPLPGVQVPQQPHGHVAAAQAALPQHRA